MNHPPSSASARLRAPDDNIQTIETQVLIIGGGVAGWLAAIGAAEAGAKCVICEKGGIIERSGSIAGGVFLRIGGLGAEFRPRLFMVFVLIPVSMTMSLLWKTKESILAGVFQPRQ